MDEIGALTDGDDHLAFVSDILARVDRPAVLAAIRTRDSWRTWLA